MDNIGTSFMLITSERWRIDFENKNTYTQLWSSLSSADIYIYFFFHSALILEDVVSKTQLQRVYLGEVALRSELKVSNTQN